MLLVDAGAFFAGLAFFDATTVLPVLMARLGAADWQIGLIRLIQSLGFALPSLFAAHYIHGRARHKPFLVTICAIGRTGLLTLPFALMLFGEKRPAVVLTWLLAVYAVFWLTDGGCAVSWFDIVAKTIPAQVRGRFFGAMQTIMGILAIGAGYSVSLILRPSGLPFPRNFALLACLWCVGAAISQAALFLIREPEGRGDDGEVKPTFVAYMRRAPALLRDNPQVGRLIIVRVLIDGAGMAAPFYILFAQRDLHLTLSMVGVFTVLQSVGKICAGPVWGWVSDRFGAAIGVRVVALAILSIPLLALASGTERVWTIAVVFFVLGAVQDGLWMVGSTALLEAVVPQDRPFAVGISSVFATPAALYGLIGGLIAQATSYPVVFACALVFAAAGFAATLRLNTERPAPPVLIA